MCREVLTRIEEFERGTHSILSGLIAELTAIHGENLVHKGDRGEVGGIKWRFEEDIGLCLVMVDEVYSIQQTAEGG